MRREFQDQNPVADRRKLIVLMPTRGTVCAETVSALVNNPEGYDILLRMVNRKSVDVARNELAALAMQTADDVQLFSRDSDPYIVWIDSDAFFLKGTLTMMLHTLEHHPSIHLLAGLFGPRVAHAGSSAFRDANDRTSIVTPDVDCSRGELVDVEHVGLHFCLHRVSLLRALGDQPFGAPDAPNTEDAAFCGRIRHINGRITVATGIPIFHVDERNGTAYSPGVEAVSINQDTIETTLKTNELAHESRSYGTRVDLAVVVSDAIAGNRKNAS